MATTPKYEVDRCNSTLATQKWFPKAYIEWYVVAISKGGVLIEITSPLTSSLLVMLSTIAMGNQFSKGGNYVRASG